MDRWRRQAGVWTVSRALNMMSIYTVSVSQFVLDHADKRKYAKVKLLIWWKAVELHLTCTSKKFECAASRSRAVGRWIRQGGPSSVRPGPGSGPGVSIGHSSSK